MSRPIRILELRSVRGTGGGPEKTILNGARLSDPSRFAVTVCYIRDRRDEHFGVTVRAEQAGVDYIEVLERHSFDPSIWGQLREIITRWAIDIVHGHDYKTNLLAWLLHHATGVRFLATSHGWTGHSARERFVYYPSEKRLLARFPRVVAVSSDIRNELIRHGASDGHVVTILNGIDHTAFVRHRDREQSARAAFGIAADDIVVGAVGRLEPQKRFDLLLEAIARLRRTHSNLRLVIAGEGSQRASLEARREQLHLADGCRFLGNVSDIVIPHHAFNLFVQSSDYEGSPNAVLEAMALETPVIATDVGGTAELLTTGVHGLIVPPGDVAQLAGAIESALSDRATTAARAAAARQRVERDLSFESRMRKLEAIYEELMPATDSAPALAGSCL